MTTTHTRIAITEARDGDEIYQAGTWVRIDGVTLMAHSSNVSVRFTDGGTHNAPAHHFTVRRPNVTAADLEPEARYALYLPHRKHPLVTMSGRAAGEYLDRNPNVIARVVKVGA